jgi:hypothetical protein
LEQIRTQENPMKKILSLDVGVGLRSAGGGLLNLIASASSARPTVGLVLVMLAASVTTAWADRQVNISVKVIKSTNGTRPSGGVADYTGFQAEIAHGNTVLANTGRGYRLVTVEFVDIQPPVPSGQPADYWYSLNARANKATVEAAALADQTTWLWRTNAINVYVNNSGSGSCSFPPDSYAITLGKTLYPVGQLGTVVHEFGHFFNLYHTHQGDNDGAVGPWTDGDGLAETLPDDPDATLAQINAQYPGETQQKRDDLYYNVMSYHVESRLLPGQMNTWETYALGVRSFALSRRTWYVANDGNDSALGDGQGVPFGTLSHALNVAATIVASPPTDLIMLYSGTYTAPGNRISTPSTLRAYGGTARIIKP